jgi:hypothetical protein
VIIAPRAVLTAGHCVDRYRGWGVLAPYAGRQSVMSYEAVVYDWDSGMTYDPKAQDVALVFLPEDFELDSYPALDPEPLESGSMVVAVGRVRNGFITDEALFVSQPFQVFPEPVIQGVEYPYVYATAYRTIQRGDSGGPVYLADAEPRRIVGVNSATQLVARVDLLHGWIVDQVAAHEERSRPTE